MSAIKTAIKEMKMREGPIDIVIALGHAGFEVDKQIAREVDEVKIVVGGHTNTFLYTGKWSN